MTDLPAGRALDREIAEQWVGLHVFDLPVADDPECGFPEPMVDSLEELAPDYRPDFVDRIGHEYAERWPADHQEHLARIQERLASGAWNARIDPCYHDTIGEDGAPRHAVPIPDYSTVDGDALTLLDTWPGDADLNREQGAWHVTLTMPGIAVLPYWADAETLPLAICRAVLLAARDGVRPKA